jgi:hypothetical protein
MISHSRNPTEATPFRLTVDLGIQSAKQILKSILVVRRLIEAAPCLVEFFVRYSTRNAKPLSHLLAAAQQQRKRVPLRRHIQKRGKLGTKLKPRWLSSVCYLKERSADVPPDFPLLLTTYRNK